MRVRTFLALITLLLVAAAVVFVLLPNRAVLEQPLLIAGYEVPVWGTIVGALAIGVFFSLVFQLTGLGKGAWWRARSMWSTRHREVLRRALEGGRHAERDGRLDEAIGLYTEAVRQSPGDFRAHMLLGDALRTAGSYDRAIGAHEQAGLIDGSSDEPVHALALDHLAAGHLDKAKREARRLADRNPQAAVGPLRKLRAEEIRAGRWESAAESQQLLAAAFKRGKLPEEDQRQGLGIRTELARLRARSGQPRQAIGTLRKMIKSHPQFLPARHLLATLKHESGETKEARALWVEGFELTGEPAMLDAIAAMDLEREHPEEAISTLRGQVAARQHDEAARLALGRLYARLEMLDEAVGQLERVHEETGRSRLAAYHLALVEQRRGRADRAAALMREMLEAPEAGPAAASCQACRAAIPGWRAACPECGAFGMVVTEWSSIDPPVVPSSAEAPAYVIPRT